MVIHTLDSPIPFTNLFNSDFSVTMPRLYLRTLSQEEVDERDNQSAWAKRSCLARNNPTPRPATMQGLGSKTPPQLGAAIIARSRRRASKQSNFDIYCDPPEMSAENATAVSEFIKGAPPGEVGLVQLLANAMR